MEKAHRLTLRHCRQKIVEDLDVTDVLDSLIENEIVDEEQLETIQSRSTRAARVRCLLDTLPTRGPRAFQTFLGALKVLLLLLLSLLHF